MPHLLSLSKPLISSRNIRAGSTFSAWSLINPAACIHA